MAEYMNLLGAVIATAFVALFLYLLWITALAVKRKWGP